MAIAENGNGEEKRTWEYHPYAKTAIWRPYQNTLKTETRPGLTSVHNGTDRGTLTKAARGKKFSLDPFFEWFGNHYSSKFL